MSVKETRNLLFTFAEKCEEQHGRGAETLQREIICDSVMKFFPEVNSEVIQYELLKNGLFEPTEWKSLKKTVRKLELNHVWDIVKQEYKYLRELWGGPKVSIYIYPIKKKVHSGERIFPVKTGSLIEMYFFFSSLLSLTKKRLKH